MLEQDQDEAYNKKLEEIEYLAAFINPKAVESIQASRSTVTESNGDGLGRFKAQEEEFGAMLEHTFGHKLDKV